MLLWSRVCLFAYLLPSYICHLGLVYSIYMLYGIYCDILIYLEICSLWCLNKTRQICHILKTCSNWDILKGVSDWVTGYPVSFWGRGLTTGHCMSIHFLANQIIWSVISVERRIVFLIMYIYIESKYCHRLSSKRFNVFNMYCTSRKAFKLTESLYFHFPQTIFYLFVIGLFNPTPLIMKKWTLFCAV